MPLYKAIEQAIKKRETFFKSTETNAFRLCNSGGDNCEGLIIDYYNGFILLQLYDSSLYSFIAQICDYCKKALESLHIPINGILEWDTDIRMKALVVATFLK